MDTDPILTGLLSILAEACDRQDGAKAAEALEHIKTHAGVDFANRLLDKLIAQGYQQLARR